MIEIVIFEIELLRRNLNHAANVAASLMLLPMFIKDLSDFHIIF